MAESILTPGSLEIDSPSVDLEIKEPYLKKDNCLAEFETEAEKASVRANLGVLPESQVYTQTLVDINIGEAIQDAFLKYLGQDDPPITEETARSIIRDALLDYVKNSDLREFLEPARNYTDFLLESHINRNDPHKILPQVDNKLSKYIKSSEVYYKNQLYTKNEIDQLNSQYIKRDGSTPFTRPLIGVNPQIDSHLSTKRYVDSSMQLHKVEVDPHGFISILNKRLASYAKTANVYDKTQTYSRVLIESIIRSLVQDAANEAISTHANLIDPHGVLNEVRKLNFIKQDGSIPFNAPLKGIDAVDPLDLVTLHQVEEKVNDKEAIWMTSGPVETTVGFVEDNSDIPELMTLQEIMDAIFYGKLISLTVPDYITIGSTGEITMCIHGSTAMIQVVELYQNDKIIYSFNKDDFENGCVTVNSDVVTEDTEFTFRVIYTNDTVLEDSKIVKCSSPVFVGLLPKWKFGHTITMEYLKELSLEEPENNKFIEGVPSEIVLKYSFRDPQLRHPFVVVPSTYSDLDNAIIKSLSFSIDAFDVIDMIPLRIEEINDDIIFKVYIYRLALSSLNQEVTFNFKTLE